MEPLHILSPCEKDFEDMPGDDRSRFCDSCGLSVQNVTFMSAAEVHALLQTPGRVCVAVEVRRPPRRTFRFRNLWRAAVVVLAGLFGVGCSERDSTRPLARARGITTVA